MPYQTGVLRAVGYNGNHQVGAAELRSAAAPAQFKLAADRKTIKANDQDLSYVTVEVLDNAGIRNPKATTSLKFTLDGPGTIVGVGNANPTSIESYQLPQRNAWQGRCLVIIKSSEQTGKITLHASAEGLPAAEVTVVAE